MFCEAKQNKRTNKKTMTSETSYLLPTNDDHIVPEEFRTAELNTMLRWSALAYSFAELRKIIKAKEGTIQFKKPELVYTQNFEGKPPYEKTHLRYPITAAGVSEFIQLNQEHVISVPDGFIAFNPDGNGRDVPSYAVRQLSFVDDEFDAEIVEFDDEFLGGGCMGLSTELVFSVIVNRTQKRIVVTFRGSVNIKDVLVDISILKSRPEDIEDFADPAVRFHSGMASYLFGETAEAVGDSKECKYDQVLNILKQVYGNAAKDGHDYSDYKLYITGHSLGGALTQMLAYTLAGSNNADFIPKPIYGVSYASPTCGNYAYQKQFMHFEKEGKLRHIRVSNEGDIIPTGPSVGYDQTGLSLHVLPDKRMEIKYHNNKRNMIRTCNCGFTAKHSLDRHEENLFIEENADILRLSIDELYAKYVNYDDETS